MPEGILGFVSVIDGKNRKVKTKRVENKKNGPHLHKTKTYLFIPTGGKDGVGDPQEGDEERSLGGVRHDVRRDGVLRGRSARGTQQVMGGVVRHPDPLLRAQPPVTSSTLCSAKARSAPEQRALLCCCSTYRYDRTPTRIYIVHVRAEALLSVCRLDCWAPIYKPQQTNKQTN